VFTVEPPFNSQNDRVYAPVDNRKRHIDPSRLVRMSVVVSVAVSQVGMTELIYLSILGWRWTDSITAMFCCLSRCFQQSNLSQNVVYSQNNMLLMAKLVIFCSVISQGKVVALDRWGGKWNHLSM